MHIDIQKIVLHKAILDAKADEYIKHDTVFIFTPHKIDEINFLSFQISFPPGDKAEEWIEREIGTTTYETVYEGQEVKAPE